LRRRDTVVVDERQEPTSRYLNPGVSRRGGTQPSRLHDHLQCEALSIALNQGRERSRGSIIDDHNLEAMRVQLLPADTFQTISELGVPVARRHNDS
jgi:hypothetical protein